VLYYDILLPLAFFAAMGVLIGGAVIVIRRFRRANRETLLGLFDRVTVADFELPDMPRSFRCSHMSVMNVASASCGICGPMKATS
jgi:hypothetical protein